MRTRRTTPALPAGTVALDTIVELGPGRLADEHVAEAERLRTRVRERLALGDGLSVVALVGGTGVGKSALVNRLVGAPLATEGVRRPTTERPLAVAAAGFGAPQSPGDALLDWLGIDEATVAPEGFPDGLLLLDLPDHDSVLVGNRRLAARLAERVDGLFVVVDPVKYARADLHEGPLAALTDHAEVVTVVLNRVDELDDEAIGRCRNDLLAKLAATGHERVEVLLTSAADGTGIEALHRRLRDLVTTRSVAHRRLSADVAAFARRVDVDLPALPAPLRDTGHLLDALLEATDAHRIVAEAGVAYRRDARTATRSPLARVALLPVRGVVEVGRAFGIRDPVPGNEATPVSPARVETVIARELGLVEATGEAHVALGSTIERLAAGNAPVLGDAVGGVGVRPTRRRWWPVLAAVRGLAEACALVGFVWLALLGIVDWLELPGLPTPQLTPTIGWPTALLLGGLLLRLLLGAGVRVAVSRGAARHRERVGRQLRARLATVVDERILAPYAEELDRHVRLREALEEARDAADRRRR